MAIKIIKDYHDYSITDTGKVWSEKYKRWLKPTKDKGGYLQLCLGRGNSKRVHRLVLETFIGSCPQGMESCHNNGNKLDNRLENLRWDTTQNNIKDSIKHGTAVCIRVGEKSNHHTLTKTQVEKVRKLSKDGYKQYEIAKMFSICRQTVSQIVLRKTWKHIGGNYANNVD